MKAIYELFTTNAPAMLSNWVLFVLEERPGRHRKGGTEII